MIVVAIIGVLAAIAIPQYERYVIKAQITRVYGELGGGKTDWELCLSGMTNCADTVFTCSSLLHDTSHITQSVKSPPCPPGMGRPLLTNATNSSGAGNLGGAGSITAFFGQSAHARLHNGSAISFNRAPDGVWTCLAVQIPSGLAPAGCLTTP